ncbi:MAG: NUDIX domain-containing protein [Candidatus Nanohaloarchaea archaeon]
MRTEKGVMVVAYKQKNAPRYLVLKRKKNWEGWETPKGHLEDGDYTATVKEEMREEAGIDEYEILSIKDMDETVEWTFEDNGEKVKREYRGYLVEISPDAHVDVSGNPHHEHEHGFFFSYRDVHGMITYDNNRELLEKAYQEVS